MRSTLIVGATLIQPWQWRTSEVLFFVLSSYQQWTHTEILHQFSIFRRTEFMLTGDCTVYLAHFKNVCVFVSYIKVKSNRCWLPCNARATFSAAMLWDRNTHCMVQSHFISSCIYFHTTTTVFPQTLVGSVMSYFVHCWEVYAQDWKSILKCMHCS